MLPPLHRLRANANARRAEPPRAAVDKEGGALKYDNEHRDGLALQYASETLQNDKEVVLAAVTEYAYALKYASKELQEDPEVRAAYKRSRANGQQF